MPETAIGYVPDVGATHYLSLLDGKIGRYLALTGIEVKGRACQDIGLATHYVPSESIPVLHHRLQSYGDFDNHGGIHAILSAIEDHEVPFDSHQVRERKGLNYWRADEPDSPTRLRGIVREALDVAFAKDSIVGIIESLRLNIIEEDPYQGGRTVSPEEKDLSEWAKETIELLKSRSQVSLEVTLEAMRRAEKELDEEEQKLAKEGRRYNSVEPNSALKKALLREYRTVERFVVRLPSFFDLLWLAVITDAPLYSAQQHGFSPDFPSACISKLVDKKPPTFSTEPSSSTLINSFFPTLPEAYYSKPSPNLPLTEPLNLETPVHGFDKYPFRAFGLPSEDDLKSIINGSHPSHTTRSSPYAQDRIPGDFKVSVEMVLAKYDMSRKRMKSRVMEVLRRKCTEDSAGWLTWHDGKRPRRADEWKYDKMEGQGHLWERLGDKQEIVVEDK
jgi:3-hydroxyisobutyryl-CoA hydrolase